MTKREVQMAETYSFECECGKLLRVKLFEAGTKKTCPFCQTNVTIPNSTKLKELSGDKHPLLRPIEKIRQTCQLGESPFDGTCHQCQKSLATFQTPCTLNVMVERHVADHGGIRPTLTGVKLAVGASEEFWQATTFPLLLCQQCQSQFLSDKSSARTKSGIKLLGLLGLLIAFLYFAYNNAELVAVLSGVFWLIGAIALAARFRDNKKLAPYLNKWLSKIRWVPEAIASEEEYKLSIGDSQPISK